jgi:hypothetical protein
MRGRKLQVGEISVTLYVRHRSGTHTLGGVSLMEAVKADPPKPIPIRHWKPLDWIDHASFGVGQVVVGKRY